MSAAISRDEWLKALSDAGCPIHATDDQALTTQEFCALTGLKRFSARHRLDKLVETGRATLAHKWEVTPAGRRIQVRAYRLVNAPKPAKKRR